MELFLANLTALFHGLVILPILIIVPLVLLFSKKRIFWLERTFLAVGILTGLSFLFYGACFLTIWEQDLLQAAGEPTYSEGFVRYYLGKLFNIDWPDIWTTWLIRGAIAVGSLKLIWNWVKDRKI